MRSASHHILLALVFFSSFLPFIARSVAAAASRGEAKGAIVGFIDHRHLKFEQGAGRYKIGDRLAIRSKTSPLDFIGYIEVTREDQGSQQGEGKILSLSPSDLVQPGDSLVLLDLSTDQDLYKGQTGLLIQEKRKNVSVRYRPLVWQGFSIGETAQTLDRHEVLATIFGQVSYGLTDSLMVGAFVPGFLFHSPNAQVKTKIFGNGTDDVSAAIGATKLATVPSTAVNLTMYWDSVHSQKLISHTLATFAVATIDQYEDAIAIKAAGTSSLQTGYEIIFENWNRLLFGPSYNFDVKSIGGYIAYKAIWDHFHFSTALSTVDVRELKFDAKTGYVLVFEAYWRY